MVLTDLIGKYQPDIEMFSLDTGRLRKKRDDLMQQVRERYRYHCTSCFGCGKD